jgi:eukaryotic-like serine/threonine-protein kinase
MPDTAPAAEERFEYLNSAAVGSRFQVVTRLGVLAFPALPQMTQASQISRAVDAARPVEVPLPPVAGASKGGGRQSIPAPLPSGLGSWEPVELAAEGGLSRVYRARPAGNPHATALYALKRLRPEWEDDDRAVAMLRREALVGRSLSHPNLVAVLSSRTIRSPRFVVMPWLEGTTLAARLAAGGKPNLCEALWIARQTAEALGALDEAGWMHGDVKPGNIFLSPEGRVTLLDLGFARRREEPASVTDRFLACTCGYMAPEYLTSALRADGRSDMYSLGVVLYEMLCGRLPFESPDPAELIAEHLRSAPPDPKRLAPWLPDDVATLLRRALAKDPMRRPQTPGEMAAQLARLEIAALRAAADAA